MAQLPLPRYSMEKNGRTYEVHYGTIRIISIKNVGFVGTSTNTGLKERLHVTYSCIVGGVVVTGEAVLCGRYVAEVMKYALGNNSWACAIAFETVPEVALVSVVPAEYIDERSLFNIL